MKAIVQDGYGGSEVLHLGDVEMPTPKGDEVLVQVRAASLHPDVWHVMRGVPYALRLMGSGLRRPKNRVPGTDVAGIVDSVGVDVTRFRPGDEVFGETARMHEWKNGGAFAEFVAAPEAVVEPKPARFSFEEAASIPASATIAVQGIRDEGRVQAGDRVLVNGAGGGVGIFAVQIAKALGAEVMGVDDATKLEMIRSIGADQVIDYTEEDFVQSGSRYDVILDVAGTRPFSVIRRALADDGTYVLIGHDHFGAYGRRWIGSLGRFLKLLVMSPFTSQLTGLRGARDPGDRLSFVRSLIEAGKITPVLDRTFPLAEVPEAIRYLESGKNLGKVVITV